ncbi:MAG: hypothetical protein ACE144_13055 [Thermodesulfobacteriota bacterium]
MLREDFVIQTNIRRILIRSNVDYSGITFGTVRGVVYIQGIFKLSGVSTLVGSKEEEDFISKSLRSFELKVRSIPGVVDVRFQFRNWKKEKGQWLRTRLTE